MAKALYLLIICCGIFIATIAGGLLYVAFQPDEKAENEIAVCGNTIGDGLGPEQIEGKELFNVNCASCHSVTRDATGPALVHIPNYRTQEWLCKFLTNPNFQAKDSIAKELRKTWQNECRKFPELSCDEVKELFNFVSYYKY